MIAALIRRLHRAFLQARVRWYEADIDGIARQRINDIEAEFALRHVADRDKRRIRVMLEKEAEERAHKVLDKFLS